MADIKPKIDDSKPDIRLVTGDKVILVAGNPTSPTEVSWLPEKHQLESRCRELLI